MVSLQKHARPMSYMNCGFRGKCYCYSRVTRHNYCCSCDVGACFPGHSSVTVVGSKYNKKTMSQLRTGDKVLAGIFIYYIKYL